VASCLNGHFCHHFISTKRMICMRTPPSSPSCCCCHLLSLMHACGSYSWTFAFDSPAGSSSSSTAGLARRSRTAHDEVTEPFLNERRQAHALQALHENQQQHTLLLSFFCETRDRLPRQARDNHQEGKKQGRREKKGRGAVFAPHRRPEQDEVACSQHQRFLQLALHRGKLRSAIAQLRTQTLVHCVFAATTIRTEQSAVRQSGEDSLLYRTAVAEWLRDHAQPLLWFHADEQA
jgi:hypothetical protein